MTQDLTVVFGGSGFVGSAVARKLLAEGKRLRLVARRPERFSAPGAGLERMAADLRDEGSVRAALEGASAAVNAVGLYHERGGLTFQAIHVEGARRLAAAARAAGLTDLVQLSGIAADTASRSAYLRARAEGEAALRAEFPDAVILRPSAIYAPDGGLVTDLAAMLRRTPVFPLFGDGSKRLQPVALADVAAAVAASLARPDARGRVFELGGARAYSYRELLARILATMGRRCLLLPVPFAVWESLAVLLGPLSRPPVTLAQVLLMGRDNLASPDLGGLSDLGIRPSDLEAALAAMVARR
jgi:NADH dehydrogenase